MFVADLRVIHLRGPTLRVVQPSVLSYVVAGFRCCIVPTLDERTFEGRRYQAEASSMKTVHHFVIVDIIGGGHRDRNVCLGRSSLQRFSTTGSRTRVVVFGKCTLPCLPSTPCYSVSSSRVIEQIMTSEIRHDLFYSHLTSKPRGENFVRKVRSLVLKKHFVAVLVMVVGRD